MIEMVDLSDWKKLKIIRYELHSEFGINISQDGREWRTAVEKWNKKYKNGEVDYFITHSPVKGFKATKNYEEAMIGRNDYLKKGITLIKKARDVDEAFRHLDNFKIDFERGEII